MDIRQALTKLAEQVSLAGDDNLPILLNGAANEIEQLQQRNAELAAQVECLTEAYTKELNELAQKNYDIRHVNKSQALAEHDREVAARVGRAGYMEGYRNGWNDRNGNDEYDIYDIQATEYANKIKSGEVKI